MSITLNAQLEADVLSRVTSGRFADPMEVLSEAMRLLTEHEKLNALRAAIAEAQEDAARGNYRDWSHELMDTIVEESRGDDELDLPILAHVQP